MADTFFNSDLKSKLYDVVAKANEDRDYQEWHASSIAECPRAQYFKRLAIPPVSIPTAAKMLRWDVGHKMETAIRPHLQALYPNLLSNQRLLSKELELTGEFDNYNPDTSELIEVKSIHPYGLKHLEAEGKPHLHYLLQQHAYVKLLKVVDRLEVKKISFVYIALDGRLMCFSMLPEDRYMLSVEKRLEVLNKAWKSQTPPDCLCIKDGKFNKEHPLWLPQMQYCPYQNEDKCCNLDLLKGVVK